MQTSKHACKTKRTYNTKALANKALGALKGKGKKINTLHVYKCNVCKKFHIGSKPNYLIIQKSLNKLFKRVNVPIGGHSIC